MSAGRRRSPSSTSDVTEPSSAKVRVDAAAVELFAVRGFAGTSMADVATLAGVSNGSLFHHYPTKLELGVATWARAYSTRLALTVGPIETEPTHERVVRAIVTGHAASIEDDPTTSLLLMTQEPPAAVVERYYDLLADEQRHFTTTVEGWLRRAAAEGAMRRLTFDSGRALIIGPVTDHGRRWLLGRTATRPRALAKVLAAGAWAAVAAPPDRRERSD